MIPTSKKAILGHYWEELELGEVSQIVTVKTKVLKQKSSQRNKADAKSNKAVLGYYWEDLEL